MNNKSERKWDNKRNMMFQAQHSRVDRRAPRVYISMTTADQRDQM